MVQRLTYGVFIVFIGKVKSMQYRDVLKGSIEPYGVQGRDIIAGNAALGLPQAATGVISANGVSNDRDSLIWTQFSNINVTRPGRNSPVVVAGIIIFSSYFYLSKDKRLTFDCLYPQKQYPNT